MNPEDERLAPANFLFQFDDDGDRVEPADVTTPSTAVVVLVAATIGLIFIGFAVVNIALAVAVSVVGQ